MPRMLNLLLICICVATSGCAASKSDVPKNSAVRWDGTFVGLMYELNTPAAQHIRAEGIVAKDKLLRALADPDHYIAAHLLLTEVFGPDDFYLKDDEWNGLHVILRADGRITYDPSDFAFLQCKWADHFKTQ